MGPLWGWLSSGDRSWNRTLRPLPFTLAQYWGASLLLKVQFAWAVFWAWAALAVWRWLAG